MDYLRQENYQASLSLLTRAADMLDDPALPVKLQAITLNNLGCFYKRTGKLGVALQYLHKALELDATSAADLTNLAGTHLNVCAIHSTLGRHDKALKHAYEALELMKGADQTPNNAATTAIAYHNAGVEEEHLKNFDRAAELYSTGWRIASDILGPGHPLADSLRESSQALAEAQAKRGRQVKDVKLPSLTKKRGHRRSLDDSYRKMNSQSVVNTRDSTPDKVRMPFDAIKSAPGTSNYPKHRKGASGRSPRVFRFTKHDTSPNDAKSEVRRLPTLSLWSRLQKAAIVIQSHWRGYAVRKRMRKDPVIRNTSNSKRSEAERMAKEALKELEVLKHEAEVGKMLTTFQSTIKDALKPNIAGKISGYTRPRNHTFHKPLSPIPESSENMHGGTDIVRITQRVRLGE